MRTINELLVIKISGLLGKNEFEVRGGNFGYFGEEN